MTLTSDQIALLEAPLDQRRVFKRQGKYAYIKSHDAKRTANRIFGHDGWTYTVDEIVSLGEEPAVSSDDKPGFRVGYRATVTLQVGDVRRGDVGYGDAVDYSGSRIAIHELAAKEAVSDALKRCLSSFGDQFGLCLYGDDPAPAQPARPEPPKDQPTDDQMRELIRQAGARGYPREQISALLSAEQEAHGGYRRSWWNEQMTFLSEAAA